MDQINKYQHIAHLIVKERLTGLNKTETEVLNQWISENQDHQYLYERLRKLNPAEVIQNYKNIDTERGLQNYHRYHSSKSRSMPARWMAIAAVGLILLGVGTLLLFRAPSIPSLKNDLQPGAAKALLILADGSIKELEQIRETETILLEGVSIRNSGNEIQYTPMQISDDTTQTILPIYNTLKIPTGGEYMLILADGTKVWINSQTELRYPVNFTGKERTVYLKGEAYFEVSHDTARPFFVRMGNEVNVEVLGTSFNVRSYENEQEIEAVLEQGSVKMWRHNNSVTLTPHIKAVYNKNNGLFTTQTVNTELYTAWHKGQYIFEEETIENILHKLSRWYDINVFFVNEDAKRIIFSGNVRKYDTIQQLLRAIERTGSIHFQIKGNTIIVNTILTK